MLRNVTTSGSVAIAPTPVEDYTFDFAGAVTHPILTLGNVPSSFYGRTFTFITGPVGATIELDPANMLGPYPGASFTSTGEGYLTLRYCRNKFYLEGNSGPWSLPSDLWPNGFWNDTIIWQDQKIWR